MLAIRPPNIENRTFKTPVIVEPGRLGHLREERSVWEAMRVLHGRWPEARDESMTLRWPPWSALLGEMPADVARRAFVEAAKEARVLVPPDAYLHSAAASRANSARKKGDAAVSYPPPYRDFSYGMPHQSPPAAVHA